MLFESFKDVQHLIIGFYPLFEVACVEFDGDNAH